MSVIAYWFWSLLTLSCLVWYSTVALVVAVKGAIDIRGMLSRLKHTGSDGDNAAPDGCPGSRIQS